MKTDIDTYCQWRKSPAGTLSVWQYKVCADIRACSLATTDRQTNNSTVANTGLCIARYADALEKKKLTQEDSTITHTHTHMQERTHTNYNFH